MRCKFYNKCEHASTKALTCESGGGTYCGKYRVLSAEASSGIGAGFICHPLVHLREMLA